MADKDLTPKPVASELDAETFLDATEQAEILIGTDTSISIPSAAQADLSSTEINQDARMYSDISEPFIRESSSIPISSNQTDVGASEDEQQSAEDDPTVPLIFSRDGDVTLSTTGVDDRTYESSRSPSVECMRCCFIINYNIREDEQLTRMFIPYIRKELNSRFILLALIALLAIPISSIYFGVVYKDSCPVAKYSSVFLITMGIVGVIFIVVRLLTLIIRRFIWNMEKTSKIISISLIFMLTVLMIIEMVSFYIQKPVFDNPKDPSFCEKTFYDYVFYMNFAVVVIGFLALLFHIPQKVRSAEQMLPQ